jgi:hypothetical protein
LDYLTAQSFASSIAKNKNEVDGLNKKVKIKEEII